MDCFFINNIYIGYDWLFKIPKVIGLFAGMVTFIYFYWQELNYSRNLKRAKQILIELIILQKNLEMDKEGFSLKEMIVNVDNSREFKQEMREFKTDITTKIFELSVEFNKKLATIDTSTSNNKLRIAFIASAGLFVLGVILDKIL
jgi:hypothetical protein